MATVTKPIALDESLNTTELSSRNVADVLAQELSAVATAIGGIAIPSADHVNYDNSGSGLSATDVQNALDEIVSDIPTVNDGTLTIQQNGEAKGTFTANQSGNSTVNIETPTTDIQTAVDEFSTYNGGLLSECKVALSPNQDLHGYDSPWVGGASKQMIPMTLAGLKAQNDGGTWSGDTYTINGRTFEVQTDNGGNVTGILVNGSNASASNFRLSKVQLGSASEDLFSWLSQTGTYKITSGLTGDNSTTYGVYYRGGSDFVCDIVIRVNYSASNLLFKPMVRLATESEDFAPYSNICPISGHTQVEVENHQKNLFNPSNVLNAFFFGGYNITDEPQTRTIYAQCKPNTVYTVSKTAGQRFCVGYTKELPANGVVVYDKTSDNTASSITITTGADAKYIVGYVYHAQHDSITADEMLASCQIELGSTATAYEPYNGYQVTVNLGGTYYSGTLDVVSGVLMATYGMKDLGLLNWSVGTDSISQYFYADVSDIKKSASPLVLPTAICEIYKPSPSSDVADYSFAVSASTTMIYIRDTSIADEPTFVSRNTGYKIVYELATPTPIQLSPTMVKALVGENHLSAPLDGQEITESKYKQMFTFDDVIAYIQSL